MLVERVLVRDAIGSFAPGQALRAALLLTYSFDGKWLEEAFVPDLFERPIAAALVIRDANRIITEAPTVRYHRVNAAFSTRVFHPKLSLLVAEDRALAIIGSANLTRGGLERNLELGSVFEISREGGPRQLFEGILSYIEGPLAKELKSGGSAAASLRDAAVALREVLAAVPDAPDTPFSFLHSYDKPLWEQVLGSLPHRHIARITVLSPFFEPNVVEQEDPGIGSDDGLFDRMFTDLVFHPANGEKPVSIFFQQSEGKTLLPVDKLRRRKGEISLFQRLVTSDEPRPLHGKFLAIEGAPGKDREPYLFAIHGSPNFTSAAFLTCPPVGNSEIAVLTRLPAKRNASARIRSALGLPQLFGVVNDWTTLTHVAPVRDPPQAPDSFRVTDATLHVHERKLDISWEGNTPSASAAQVLIETGAAWMPIASGTVAAAEKFLILNVPDLVQIDRPKLLSLKSTRVQVQLVDSEGGVIASSTAPINVDCPEQFCGAVLVGAAMSTLDERIAFAGWGTSYTYRQQLDFIERQRASELSSKMAPKALAHQADLDRFFRNLQTGFRGIKTRVRSMPSSEYTIRRTIKDLARWCWETIHQEQIDLSTECRIFLIDRLARELDGALQSFANNAPLTQRLKDIATEFQLSKSLRSALEWLKSCPDPRVGPYIADTSGRLAVVIKSIEDAGASDAGH
ncbi:phospholipase D family protein [Bradyrhizobium sp. ARR65]|uniref:phospholipase D family protein n=1 Tax=Bradyrhizobium sp. ARR65 TaxID=1040989 RepID=UPI0004676AD9|nr:phospholipase D family protein [Bradyrhizobium sp. ARR65]